MHRAVEVPDGLVGIYMPASQLRRGMHQYERVALFELGKLNNNACGRGL